MKSLPSSIMSPSFSLSPNQFSTHPIIFQINTFLMPQKIAGILYYMVGGNKTVLNLQLSFPCSAFILPSQITKDQFGNILDPQSEFNEGKSMHLSTTKLTVTEGLKSVLTILVGLMHLEIVDHIGNAGSLYGKSIQGHHVAVLAKQKSIDLVVVDLRCSDETLCSSLISELTEHFKPHLNQSKIRV